MRSTLVAVAAVCLTTWGAASQPRACEALIGAEYTDPIEMIPLGLDPAEWHVASRVRDEAIARKDLVKASDTLSAWSELVSWQITFGSKKWDLEAVKNDFLTRLGYQCAEVKFAVLRKDESDLVFEWWHGDCYDRPEQYHIERLVIGRIGTHLLSYGRKGPKPADAERDAWVERLAKLEIQNRLSGASGPLERARTAIATRDYPKALAVLERLAKKGNAEAQEELAGMYAGGWGVTKSYPKALEWFRKAAAQKNAVATYNVGRMYDNGWGVPKDPGEALRWYRTAAELGEADAQGRLGFLLATAPEPRYEEAAQWFRASIERGHDHGAYWLGRLNEEGWGMPKDLRAAVELYRNAAVAGDPDAQARLGLLYREGRGVERDEKAAELWVVRAATQGSAEGQALYDAHYRPKPLNFTFPDKLPPGVVETPAQDAGKNSDLPPLPPGFSYPPAGAQNPGSGKTK